MHHWTKFKVLKDFCIWAPLARVPHCACNAVSFIVYARLFLSLTLYEFSFLRAARMQCLSQLISLSFKSINVQFLCNDGWPHSSYFEAVCSEAKGGFGNLDSRKRETHDFLIQPAFRVDRALKRDFIDLRFAVWGISLAMSLWVRRRLHMKID